MLGQLRNAGRLQLRLKLELVILLGLLFGDPFLIGGIDRGLGLVSGLCMSRRLSFRSLCIRNFSTTDGPWLLRLGGGHLLHLLGRGFAGREVRLR